MLFLAREDVLEDVNPFPGLGIADIGQEGLVRVHEEQARELRDVGRDEGRKIEAPLFVCMLCPPEDGVVIPPDLSDVCPPRIVDRRKELFGNELHLHVAAGVRAPAFVPMGFSVIGLREELRSAFSMAE